MVMDDLNLENRLRVPLRKITFRDCLPSNQASPSREPYLCYRCRAWHVLVRRSVPLPARVVALDSDPAHCEQGAGALRGLNIVQDVKRYKIP